MPRPRRQRALVDGEFLDCGFLECAAEAGQRVTVIEVLEVAFAVARHACDVEAGPGPRPRERNVTPLLQSCLAGSKDESAFDGEALGGVPGERVSVSNVSGCEVG